MIRQDRLLLAELGRLNTDVVPLAMRIMDESATVEEHYVFAERLEAMARLLQTRAEHVGLVVAEEVAVAADQDVNGSADTVPMSGFWASLRALSSRASSAAYPDAGNDFAHRTVLDHEALKPWTVEEIWMLNGTEPNHYVDVTDTFDQKIEALRAHRSQTGHRIIAPRHSGLTCIPVHPRLR